VLLLAIGTHHREQSGASDGRGERGMTYVWLCDSLLSHCSHLMHSASWSQQMTFTETLRVWCESRQCRQSLLQQTRPPAFNVSPMRLLLRLDGL